MIEGYVDSKGMPTVEIWIADRLWFATIDTGFNGDLELPYALERAVTPRWRGVSESAIAGGLEIREDEYYVRFPFDDRTVTALATFVPGDGILIGTRMLLDYELHIDFPLRTVRLTRADEG